VTARSSTAYDNSAFLICFLYAGMPLGLRMACLDLLGRAFFGLIVPFLGIRAKWRSIE
jgi:hypothetical protein